MAKKKLSELIKGKRGVPLSKVVSVRAAAEDAGVSAATLNRVERGGTPDANTLLRLCAWLDVDPRLIKI